MGMSAGGNKGGAKSDINVTPLVDVVLVLLIIFMVITPMLQNGKDVSLPKAKNTTGENEGSGKKAEPLIVSLTTDKKMYVDSDEYADAATFEARMKQELDGQPFRRVLLKGDNALTYGDVRKAMKAIKDAGAKGVALGVEELKE